MSDAPVLVVRYAEVGLKGGNRALFEKALVSNLKRALKGFDHGPVERPRGRIIVRSPAEPERVAAAAAKVFGIISVSPGVTTAPDVSSITTAARALFGSDLDGLPRGMTRTFRVQSRRSDKRFPMTSMELSAHLGGILLESFKGLSVDLHAPQMTLGVEVRDTEALLFCRSLAGPGGIPVGTMGRAVVLLSGGIDSPVAAWLTMKRGARAVFIAYHSYPFLSPASLDKVEALVKRLARYQHGADLFVIPFAETQVAIKQACPEPLRTVLYRRMMFRLANMLAAREGALALVTGESLGQVASQTLENIRCIGEVAELPVLRPLICYDKTESIDLARRIGTYEISIQPYPDCCTLFQPRKPRIKASLEEVQRAEADLDVDGLVAAAFDGVERKSFFP